MTTRNKIAVILVSLLTIIVLHGCKGNIDVQPPKIEVALIKVSAPDTVVYVTSDTISGKEVVVDSFQVVTQEPSTSLLVNVQHYEDNIVLVQLPPTDSLVKAVYMSQVGVRERTGKNDGKDVEKYLKSVGLPKGNAWCSAFVKWCFDQSGVKTTITAWSPTAHNKNNIVYAGGKQKKDIQRADVFTLYFPSLKRIGHTGFVNRSFGFNSVETVEGNTNAAGSREGDGVYVKVRPKSSLYSITRWF